MTGTTDNITKGITPDVGQVPSSASISKLYYYVDAKIVLFFCKILIVFTDNNLNSSLKLITFILVEDSKAFNTKQKIRCRFPSQIIAGYKGRFYGYQVQQLTI